MLNIVFLFVFSLCGKLHCNQLFVQFSEMSPREGDSTDKEAGYW